MFQLTKRKLLNMLLSLALVSLFSQPAFALDTEPNLDELNQIAQELSNESTIQTAQQIQKELQSKVESTISIAQSISTSLPESTSMELQSIIANYNPKSTTLPQLLKITKNLYNWQTQLSTTYSTSVLSEQNSMKNLSIQLSGCLDLAKKAMESNKEDTKNAINLFGEALEYNSLILEENKKLKEEWQNHLIIDSENERRFNNLYQLGNIIVPLVPISLLAACGICYLNSKDELGKNFLYAGCASLIGFEILYQGGHFIFKIW